MVSDLHAFTSAEPGKAPSYLRTEETATNPLEDPLLSLDLLARQQSLQADMLVCPGDLCDKADSQALQFAWRRVGDIGQTMKASAVIGTAGNHDIDSRHSRDLDAWSPLKRLSNYPTADASLSNEYWARHFTIIEALKECRIVNLNTSAFHGQIEIENNHGRIQNSTLSDLQAKLDTDPAPTANILLCHHHPHQHSEVLLGEDDWMKSGQLLLDLLSNASYGTWMVIHGHKHHPKLTYAAGGGTSAVVFAAGSLGAHLFPQLSSRTKNQFHVVTIDLDRSRRCGLSGWVESWSFAFGLGWLRPDGALAGLPHRAGFGFRGSPRELAGRIAPTVVGMVDWDDVVASTPDIKFLLPQDFSAMRHYLKSDHGVVLWEEGTTVRKALRT